MPNPWLTPMPFENLPARPEAIFDLFEHVFTGEHFAIHRQRNEAGAWQITGCLPLPSRRIRDGIGGRMDAPGRGKRSCVGSFQHKLPKTC